jgi:hypothetical protein
VWTSNLHETTLPVVLPALVVVPVFPPTTTITATNFEIEMKGLGRWSNDQTIHFVR